MFERRQRLRNFRLKDTKDLLHNLKQLSSFYIPPEVESSYEKAIEQEEDRITYQRKMVLLSIKSIRERESELLIRAKNSQQIKRVTASENELQTMLCNLEKQVNFHKVFHDSFRSPIVKLFTKLKRKES